MQAVMASRRIPSHISRRRLSNWTMSYEMQSIAAPPGYASSRCWSSSPPRSVIPTPQVLRCAAGTTAFSRRSQVFAVAGIFRRFTSLSHQRSLNGRSGQESTHSQETKESLDPLQFIQKSSATTTAGQHIGSSRGSDPLFLGRCVTGLIITACAGIYYHRSQLEIEHNGTTSSRSLFSALGRRPKTRLDLYNENFVCSRQNVQQGRWWVLLTSTFAHGSLWHLGINMMALWSIGPMVISMYGLPVFTAIWVGTGVGSSALGVYWPRIRKHLPEEVRTPAENFFQLRESKPAVGASGALSGLIGALGPSPGLLLLAAVDLYCLYSGDLPFIGHTAHLTGMAMGFVSWALLLRRRGRFGRL